MLIRDFVAKYEPDSSDFSTSHVFAILDQKNAKYRSYECDDAVVLIFPKEGFVKAYLLFHKFSKSVFALMVRVCKMEKCDIIAETDDPRIVGWLNRAGFIQSENPEECRFKLIRTHHV